MYWLPFQNIEPIFEGVAFNIMRVARFLSFNTLSRLAKEVPPHVMGP